MILNLKFVSFFPKELKFKCVDFSLTEQEVPFEWQSFTSSQAIKIYDEIKKKTQGDGSPVSVF